MEFAPSSKPVGERIDWPARHRMAVMQKTTARFAWIVPLVLGTLILAYGLWALRSGRVISTWGQMAYRPSVIYWVTTIALILVGILNVAFGVRLLAR